jgi:hypothetical protein
MVGMIKTKVHNKESMEYAERAWLAECVTNFPLALAWPANGGCDEIPAKLEHATFH